MPTHGTGRGPGDAAPTIGEVAAAAGVSRATVSRAFGRPQMLRPETVERVQEAARHLGYVPNRVARALSTGRFGNLALVVPDIANPFFPPMIRAVQGRADRAGFAVFLGDADEDPAREEVLLRQLSTQVEGFVLASSRLTDERIRAHAERRPLVLVNRDVEGIPRVLIDTTRAVGQAVEHLHELGHRRIAYLSGPAGSWSNRQRRRAVKRAGDRLGVEVLMVPAGRATFELGRLAVPALLATGATAVVAFDDLVAQGVLAGLSEQGVGVPAGLSVVGCDDVLATRTYPPLTTVSARSAEAGAAAVDLLAGMLTPGTPLADTRLLLDTSLVVRVTTGPPPRGGPRRP
ncbi:transcriptional regulator, LacI family [Micromonospora matsumotoense]|uniref:Transcriptional regulator, LacI family n=1 Tax=Micromonospora matsumotoense TaxID=121616 RepID=A0A1C5AR32_9ACTN|nr:LacI family DNA-binding transcriptional regulator [Micromonospora matsumotoense]SCF47697.1 transcriptional regulator, LacI family [Micromonospora matsumotoense]